MKNEKSRICKSEMKNEKYTVFMCIFDIIEYLI